MAKGIMSSISQKIDLQRERGGGVSDAVAGRAGGVQVVVVRDASGRAHRVKRWRKCLRGTSSSAPSVPTKVSTCL